MTNKIRLLIVEDDIDLGQMLKLYLELDRFEVFLMKSAEEALNLFKQESFTLGILDVNLPEIDGFELASQLRKIKSSFPIIFLTARALKEDKIKGLKLGADDYITKPFDAEELVIRITNILNRYGKITNRIQFSNFELNLDQLNLSHPSKNQKLTRREAELLYHLVKKPNTLVKTSDILEQIWGKEDYFLGKSMNVFISRLRKYLQLEPSIIIENVRGEGYILKM